MSALPWDGSRNEAPRAASTCSACPPASAVRWRWPLCLTFACPCTTQAWQPCRPGTCPAHSVGPAAGGGGRSHRSSGAKTTTPRTQCHGAESSRGRNPSAAPANRLSCREWSAGFGPGGSGVESRRGLIPNPNWKKTKLRERVEVNDGGPTAPAGAERGRYDRGQRTKARNESASTAQTRAQCRYI
eukprot:scaffold10353_cov127-Isochrysis_galbana.AAC.9